MCRPRPRFTMCGAWGRAVRNTGSTVPMQRSVVSVRGASGRRRRCTCRHGKSRRCRRRVTCRRVNSLPLTCGAEMPFVPLTPEEKKKCPPPCRDPEHDPPNMMVITEACKWVCPSCGKSTILLPPSATHVVKPLVPRWRSRATVRHAQSTVHGFGNRHADKMACDCFATAVSCDECGDDARRCSCGCVVNCGICGNPDCDNPNCQH